jgi:hypothetical protein
MASLRPRLPSTALLAATGNKIWIKVAGTWKQATTYIKIAGVWKTATPKTKVSGTWR